MTLLKCSSEMSAPTLVSGCKGSPTFMVFVISSSFSTNRSWTPSGIQTYLDRQLGSNSRWYGLTSVDEVEEPGAGRNGLRRGIGLLQISCVRLQGRNDIILPTACQETFCAGAFAPK